MNQEVPLLELLPDALVAELVARGQRRQFVDGQLIHSRGGGPPSLSVVLEGSVRFGLYGEAGGYIQNGVLGAGHCYGEATLFINKPRHYDADAIGETEIVEVAKKPLEHLMAEHPDLARALLVTLTGRLYASLEFADDIRANSLDVRIAKQVLRLHETGGFADDIVQVRQIDLAHALGQSRVSVGKALSRLQSLDLLELGYRVIRLTRPTALRQWIDDNDVNR